MEETAEYWILFGRDGVKSKMDGIMVLGEKNCYKYQAFICSNSHVAFRFAIYLDSQNLTSITSDFLWMDDCQKKWEDDMSLDGAVSERILSKRSQLRIDIILEERSSMSFALTTKMKIA